MGERHIPDHVRRDILKANTDPGARERLASRRSRKSASRRLAEVVPEEETLQSIGSPWWNADAEQVAQLRNGDPDD